MKFILSIRTLFDSMTAPDYYENLVLGSFYVFCENNFFEINILKLCSSNVIHFLCNTKGLEAFLFICFACNCKENNYINITLPYIKGL